MTRAAPGRGALASLLLAGTLVACADDSDGSAVRTTSALQPSTSVRATTGSTSGPTTAFRPTNVTPVPSTRCREGAGDTASPGGSRHDVRLGGRDGSYHRELPPGYDGTSPLPLVLDLHGYSETLDNEVLLSGFTALGDTAGFVTVVPGIDDGVPHWDDTLGSDDLQWLGLLLDHLETTLCIDQERVFVTGFSNGAMMASAMACQFSDRIAAIAPNAGLRDPAGCSPARPVPVLAFHGTADSVVAYEGGFGPFLAGQTLVDGAGSLSGVLPSTGPSVVEMAAAWAARNGCGAGSPAGEPVSSHVTRLAWDCPATGDVWVYRIDDGGHSWPGVPSSGEKPTAEISAATVAWQFFADHPLVPG